MNILKCLHEFIKTDTTTFLSLTMLWLLYWPCSDFFNTRQEQFYVVLKLFWNLICLRSLAEFVLSVQTKLWNKVTSTWGSWFGLTSQLNLWHWPCPWPLSMTFMSVRAHVLHTHGMNELFKTKLAVHWF